ncbi:hypothetical protein [Carboxylicivirga sp. RSCT41]|uniref:hypothetical protein n=1 Tax=Carboxylicivirga agarovorans TaxID=3417570 RepID=UPI003D34C017
MYKHRLNLFGALLVFMLAISCQKKEFTEPVPVQLEVLLANGESSYLSFSEGYILLKQVMFDGQRQQGGNVHFATEPGNDIGPLMFNNNSPGQIRKFDIPQGIYTNMHWRFAMEEIEMWTDNDDEDDEHDEDDGEEELEYDTPEDGGLILTGYYRNTDGMSIPLYIIVDDDEQLIAGSQINDSYGDITLTSENTYTAQLLIDPYYALQTISVTSLESAELSEGEGGDFLEISENRNEALYEIIAYRLESSLKVIIN